MKKLSVLVLSWVAINGVMGVQASEFEEVLVTAHPLSGSGLSQSSSVLAGDELAEKVQGSLGETVAGEAGIRSASFGAAVGRPVIHGLGGARVKTTEDRIDSLDVSVTSTDHAVAVEPFIANQINILKGASTLLYGGGAIGGIVDVETGRIPKKLADKNVTGRVMLRTADNADARTGALRLDGAAGDSVAWHLDAFSKRADDYDIPGEAESAAQLLIQAPDEASVATPGELLGSFLDSQGGAVGLSWVNERGFVGASVGIIDAQYGLVAGIEQDEGAGMIDLEQTRFDFEAQLNNPFQGFSKANLRFGVNDYEHQEIEGNGEPATLFENEAWEGRIELTHNPIAGVVGVFGIQLSDRDFSALGEEAFVEPVSSETIGAFWVAERAFERFKLEGGLRIEEVDHNPVNPLQAALSFTTESASLGVLTSVSDTLSLSALFDYTSRSPSIEELFSNGPHLATRTFEIGDLGLNEESAVGLSFAVNYESASFDANVTLYYTDFDDFIYQENTGAELDELPVLQYQQDDARFVGLDIEIGVHLAELLGRDLDVSFLFDTVDAELSISGDQGLPRIPADRAGIGLKWHDDAWDIKLNYVRVSEQNDLANFELPTDSYDDLSLRINKSFVVGSGELQLFAHGRNLTDDEQRNHTSFVKDFAPSPGRTIEVGLQMTF